jgi:RimJ/RimL family protein N-acetyltransferase
MAAQDRMDIVLRPATAADAALLLRWRNDPSTRAQSRRQEPLDWPQLIAPPPGAERETLVAELAGIPVGSMHFDYRAGECELSWTVAPERRGAGIGAAMVQAAMAQVRAEHMTAEIKASNLASQRIAEKLGFACIGEQDGMTVWRRTKPKGRSA